MLISQALIRILRQAGVKNLVIKRLAQLGVSKVGILAGVDPQLLFLDDDVNQEKEKVENAIEKSAVVIKSKWQCDIFAREDEPSVVTDELIAEAVQMPADARNEVLQGMLQGLGCQSPAQPAAHSSKEDAKAAQQVKLVQECIKILQDAGSLSGHVHLVDFYLSQEEGSDQRAFALGMLNNLFKKPAVGSLVGYLAKWRAWSEFVKKQFQPEALFKPSPLEAAMFVASAKGPTGPSGARHSMLAMVELLGLDGSAWEDKYAQLAADIPRIERTEPVKTAPCPSPQDVDRVVDKFMALAESEVESDIAKAIYLGGWLFSCVATLRFDDAIAISVASLESVKNAGGLDFFVSVIRGGKTMKGCCSVAAAVCSWNGVCWADRYLALVKKWIPNSRTVFPRFYNPRKDMWTLSETFENYAGASAAMSSVFGSLFSGMQEFLMHSPRHFLPTLAAARGFPKDDRDKLGRWKQRSGADVYDSVLAATQVRIQSEVVEALAGGWSPPKVPSVFVLNR